MINEKCPLIVRDLFSYDIVSAYPTILGKQHFDFKDIDLDNKTERSIFLGKQQINNSNLSEFLLESVDALVKYYLLENNISEEDVITSQRDGFIIKKMLQNNDEFITMTFRDYIDFMIISEDRKKFIYAADGKITVKGVSFYYAALDKIYQMFANLNFYSKSVLFSQMDNIKKAVLQATDKKLFMIPKNETSFIVSTFKGDIQLKDPDFISIDQIDKMKYFNHFFKDFLNSIYLESY